MPEGAHHSRRYLSLDLLKAWGILYLLILHPSVWLLVRGDVSGLRFPQGYAWLYTFGCRTGLHVLGYELPLLAGTTFVLMYRAGHLSGTKVWTRAVYLAFLGYSMNLLAWGAGDAWDWDVLQFIALAMIVSYLILKALPGRFARAAILVLAAVALYFSNRFPFIGHAGQYFYHIWMGDPQGRSYWAFCPWYAIFAAGILLGEVFFLRPRQGRRTMAAGVLMLGGSVLSGHFFPVYRVASIWGPSLFKPPAAFVLGIIGFAWTVIPALEMLFIRRPGLKKRLQQGPWTVYSTGILWIYLISTVIGYNCVFWLIDAHPNWDFRQTIASLPVIILGLWLMGYLIGWIAGRKKTIIYHAVDETGSAADR